MKLGFVNNVTMKVTKEQFEKDLKQPLINLGYKDYTCDDLIYYPYLIVSKNRYISNCKKIDFTETIIEDYNPELFLAHAAITQGEYWVVAKWLEKQEKNKHFVKEVTKDLFPFKLDIGGAIKIIDISCSSWKDMLIKKWSKSLFLNKYIIIEEDFYQEMRHNCTPPQKELFDEIFGKDEKHIPEGTPCLVKMSIFGDWRLRFADGKGGFYVDFKNSGLSTNYDFVHVIKELGDLKY